jgi:hypothetical protein
MGCGQSESKAGSAEAHDECVSQEEDRGSAAEEMGGSEEGANDEGHERKMTAWERLGRASALSPPSHVARLQRNVSAGRRC